MESEIIQFITKFKSLHPKAIEDAFLFGNCYWFAVILSQRFMSEIYYMPIANHFITKIDSNFYDISGLIIPDEQPISWDIFQNMEPKLSQRIQKYCIQLVD